MHRVQGHHIARVWQPGQLLPIDSLATLGCFYLHCICHHVAIRTVSQLNKPVHTGAKKLHSQCNVPLNPVQDEDSPLEMELEGMTISVREEECEAGAADCYGEKANSSPALS